MDSMSRVSELDKNRDVQSWTQCISQRSFIGLEKIRVVGLGTPGLLSKVLTVTGISWTSEAVKMLTIRGLTTCSYMTLINGWVQKPIWECIYIERSGIFKNSTWQPWSRSLRTKFWKTLYTWTNKRNRYNTHSPFSMSNQSKNLE
jgi:hypothetical protein